MCLIFLKVEIWIFFTSDYYWIFSFCQVLLLKISLKINFIRISCVLSGKIKVWKDYNAQETSRVKSMSLRLWQQKTY